MKISDLIEELETIKKDKGDIQVCILDYFRQEAIAKYVEYLEANTVEDGIVKSALIY